MKSLTALVLTVLTACATHSEEKQKERTRFAMTPLDKGYFEPEQYTYSGNSSEIPHGNHVGSSVNPKGITYKKSPKEIAPIGRASYMYPQYRFSRGRRMLHLPLKAAEFSLLDEAISKIKNEPESEIPLSAAYAERPRHPLGTQQETKPSHVNKNIGKQITFKPYKVMPPPLVRSLEPNYNEEKQKERIIFAMTPMDVGYFSSTQLTLSDVTSVSTFDPRHDPGEKKRNENIRDIRQNPIPKNAKTLVAEDIEKLRQGLAKHRMRIPVSLLPTNLNWLRIGQEINGNDSDNFGTTAKPVDVFDKYFRGAPFYWVVITAAVTVTVVLFISLMIYGVCVFFHKKSDQTRLVKRAKAAAAVDYPAYGVTGPTLETSGDCRLALSAQMYHYQHKKQMLINERTVVEQREGSLSGPESEEENEEGDYTVYECPGFAMTGDMEVNNPLFDEPTPATPGVVHVFQTKPKE